jgi:tRNA1(Val) A37 N6-methylase TrmN6
VIYPENPKVVQSEIPLIYKNTKSIKKAVNEEMKAESALCPPKKDRQVVFDRKILTFEVYHAMLAALSLVPVGKQLKVCVAGTGAGVLSMYLASHFGKRASVTSIDVNEKIVNMGKKYFGLTNDV